MSYTHGREYQLNKAVYYGIYDDIVYVRNVDTRKEYIFNEIVYDILECFSKNQTISFDSAVDKLMGIYDIDDRDMFVEDMEGFFKQLEDEKLIYNPYDSLDKSDELTAGQILTNKVISNRIMKDLTFELTYRCNEKCIHCYVDDVGCLSGDELTYDEYVKIIDEAKTMGVIKLLITGGEVTLKEKFIEIAEYASAKGILVDIFTNGINMSDEVFDRICALKPNSLSFSMYGGTPEVHDRITKIPGSYEKTLKSVLMTKAAGIDTFIKTVVIRDNIDDLENLLKLGDRIHVEVTPAYSISDKHTGASNTERRLQSVDEFIRVKKLFKKYNHGKMRQGIRFVDDFVCGAAQTGLSINPYGEVNACNALSKSYGNIREKSIKDIWEGEKELDDIRNKKLTDLCKKRNTCKFAGYCDMCMARIDEWCEEVPADICMLAEAEYRILSFEL